MAMEPQKASPMSKMDGSRLPALYSLAILDLYMNMYLLQVSKTNDLERCF